MSNGGRYIFDALTLAVKSNASDVHFECGRAPIFRIQGLLQESAISDPITEEVLLSEIKPWLLPEAYEQLMAHSDVDFSYDFGETGRFRFAAYWKG
ncbi:hypothetical protein GF391_00905, partial [Candidatus Uhrbacteria bacterium]|nr:hypothetical protein [Candidatus Uhrbacteria bacterium]